MLTVLSLNEKNISDFSEARNKLLKKAKTKWIFFVDSDEKISTPLQLEVKRLTESPANPTVAYYVKRDNYFLGKFVGTDVIIRLVRKGSGKWVRKVHEVFHPRGGRVGELRSPLIHNTADNLHDYISKINKYAEIHSEENIKEGKRSYLFKIIFYPIGKFIVTYIKSKNIVFSIMQSFHSFLSWSEMYLQHD